MEVDFKTTTEIAGAVKDGLSEFGAYHIDGHGSIVVEQSLENIDVLRFRGVSETKIPWEVEINLETFGRGTIDALRSMLRDQIMQQKGKDDMTETRV